MLHLLTKVPRSARLVVSLVVAIIIILLVQAKLSAAASFVYAWIGFSASILLFSWATILDNNPKTIATVATEEDYSRLVIFLFVVTAAFISLFAIILLLQKISNYNRLSLRYYIPLSIIAIICSWLLIHTLFTLRYAHLFYIYDTHEAKAAAQHRGGLDFPSDDAPDLLDFAYFSFVVGMTFQVSDVAVRSKRIRRLVLVHGLVSFVYNTAIVALTINILSSIIGN